MSTTKFTQHQKIIGYMITRKDEQQWFFAYDFMPPRMSLDYVYCVGYEAAARFSELAGQYPEMIESESAGKYKRRRIKWDEIALWLPLLSKDLRYMFHRAGLTAGLKQAAPEPRTEPQPAMNVKAVYKGRSYDNKLKTGATHVLAIQRLQIGQPVIIVSPHRMTYATVKEFQHDWRVV